MTLKLLKFHMYHFLSRETELIIIFLNFKLLWSVHQIFKTYSSLVLHGLDKVIWRWLKHPWSIWKRSFSVLGRPGQEPVGKLTERKARAHFVCFHLNCCLLWTGDPVCSLFLIYLLWQVQINLPGKPEVLPCYYLLKIMTVVPAQHVYCNWVL